MKVYERFDSVQGEGLQAGEPTSFVRLAGCNLNCTWCDTKRASDFKYGADVSIGDINPPKKWVCITGGEPLLQQFELAALVLKLKTMGKKISIETNGSIEPPRWAFLSGQFSFGDKYISCLVDSWDVDIKLGSSGNPSDQQIIKQWADHDQVMLKLVVANESDLEEASYWIDLLGCKPRFLISPMISELIFPSYWLSAVADFCIKKDVRLSLQVHKVIWGNRKGV